MYIDLKCFARDCVLTCDGIAAGGSILIVGSHSPGGNTVTASKNSSTPAKR